MSRADRRNDLKNGDIMTITQHKLLMMVEGRTMLNKAVNDYSAALCLVLRDELGFGHDRAQRFLRKVSEIFEDITDGRLKIEDIKKTIADEIGVVIK